MEVGKVSETLDYNAILTWLIAQEDFIAQHLRNIITTVLELRDDKA
jgi:hypothetical protein